ncbi:hypothetical protein Tco_0619625 [Tanacetum coccineum]
MDIFNDARVFLEGTHVMGTKDFHYCLGVLGGDTFDRFGGNEATKKSQKTLLKQMYENFSAPSTESLDSIFNRLQKIVSQLAILGENISQEDLNLKFLRSLPSEWNTHVVVWRNKPDLDTMSFDDLYNNFKIKGINKRLKELQA